MEWIISVAGSRTSKNWKNKSHSWEELKKRLGETVRTGETVAEYKAMSKADQDLRKDVGGFVGGAIKGGRRITAAIENRYLITLDADYADSNLLPMLELLGDFACLVYSTHKHTPEKPRLRVIVPLKRPVTPDEYGAVSRKIAEDIGIEYFDDTTYEPQRLMYWPSTSADGDFICREIDGPFLDPDAVLKRYDDWADVSSWPYSSRVIEAIRKKVGAKQADPLTKSGVVGAFCRAYDVEQAIEKFLPDIYTPCETVPDRYSYAAGSTLGGVVVYDGGKFIYSHHSTDPCCGHLLNAFDMVRLHLFGEMDEDAGLGTLPSYTAMSEMAREDESVKMRLVQERLEESNKDFGENWADQLKLDRRGAVENSLQNLIVILENDPDYKHIVFNRMSDGLEIAGTVPWEHPSRFWRDADDAQLISSIAQKYASFSMSNYNVAITKVADDRSYHPIREYLDRLPEWDGIDRVDSLLVEYLGVQDNEYVRAVTRKILCAAISRVRRPGCKFDWILVLSGPGGVGKSTLMSKLGGEWFSDSLSLLDTRDKTAAEKLQGYWIFEISELSGLRKTDENILKGFLSRQNDIYRASFGKRATPHPRQCVFFGTVNGEGGYLRDVTGNRRFWPVKTSRNYKKRAMDMTQAEVDQIWAEAKHLVDQGESLFLDERIEKMAEAEQRGAMEHDDREGVVREYLDMPLPKEWGSMGIYERHEYFAGGDFGESKHKEGCHLRRSVSNVEIWCECFGRRKEDLQRRESYEIAAIMVAIEGWEKDAEKSTERIPIYGVQRLYYRVENQKQDV